MPNCRLLRIVLCPFVDTVGPGFESRLELQIWLPKGLDVGSDHSIEISTIPTLSTLDY